MFTLEQKVDIILRYIATSDKKLQGELKKAIIKALEPDATDIPVRTAPPHRRYHCRYA